MSLWRIHTRTDFVNEDVCEYCIKNNVAVLGWSLNDKQVEAYLKKNEMSMEEFSSLRNSIDSEEKYKDLASKVFAKFSSVERLMKVEENDLIWMRGKGKYYLARVGKDSKWVFNKGEKERINDIANQLTNIQWFPASSTADESAVPGAVTTAFIKGSAFQKIKNTYVEDYSKLLYNELSEDYKYSDVFLTNCMSSFFSLLQPSDLEDLLCMYLYKDNHYITIPSTNKISTPLYECVLIDPENKDGNNTNIYIQVKKGKVYELGDQQKSAVYSAVLNGIKIHGELMSFPIMVDGDFLPYIYPINIIDSGIYSEMLNSEEKGLVKSQNCLLYNEIITKIGDKLSSNELKVLKAVLICKIASLSFFDKQDALTAIKYCSNLDEDIIKASIRELEDRHGIIGYDEQSKTYDLIAEANGFNEFKRVYARYKMGSKVSIDDLEEDLIDKLKIYEPIDTSFAQEVHISSPEWKFKKELIDSKNIDEGYLLSSIRTIDSAFDCENYRGVALLFLMALIAINQCKQENLL